MRPGHLIPLFVIALGTIGCGGVHDVPLDRAETACIARWNDSWVKLEYSDRERITEAASNRVHRAELIAARVYIDGQRRCNVAVNQGTTTLDNWTLTGGRFVSDLQRGEAMPPNVTVHEDGRLGTRHCDSSYTHC